VAVVMMRWNYRVVRRTTNGETTYAIHEVHYSDDGDPQACTEAPIEIIESTPGDLRETVQRILACLDKPILDYTDFEAIAEESQTGGDI
jgi:hypothetical protein